MTRSLPVEPSPTTAAERFATRYQLNELLGEGGMAKVHRATDLALGRDVALKQLTVTATSAGAHMAALFEREFHTLAQLSHPHVTSVFDYGSLPDGSPFYTMELLDGGDLRERSPLAWPEVCRLMFDVCSALALLHSRRLLHRDVTPRNIRCTQNGGVKLIDFGAMAPMSASGSEIVGTPAFTAPETLQRLALDARTDLYSFGVTLYFALTGRVPYGARTFAELATAWAHKPSACSTYVPDVPAALDDLVLSLISVEPGLRPSSAFEVMQRLAACAGLSVDESEAVSRAYLSTPTLVGRDAALARLQDALRNCRGRDTSGLLIQAAAGCGRSRLLDACALDALTRGFIVSRATATGAPQPFAVAERLISHILDTQPDTAGLTATQELFSSAVAANDAPLRPRLRNLAELEADHAHNLLRRFILGVSRTLPLLIAVDDVHKIDEPSAALLAELIDNARPGGILILLTADSQASDSMALNALARRCSVLTLAPLTREQTGQLLQSLFGEVANLEPLGDEVQAVALGNPRQTLELAQHLVDSGLIRYSSGSWVLPSALSADSLPRSASAAMAARIARFSATARLLAEAQALAFFEAFSDEDYRALVPGRSSRDVEVALTELLEAGVVLRDVAMYRLANRVWGAAFLATLDEAQTKERHRALAELYGDKRRAAFVHHAFSAGLFERGLSALERRNEAPLSVAETMKLAENDGGKVMWCYPLAIETARRLGRSPRELHDLRRWQYLGSVATTAPADRESARLWLEQLSHDAGLDLYHADTGSATPHERLMSALKGAHERYLATPEQARVYPVDEAIRRLGEYVLIGVVEGARALDCELLSGLPDILLPFAPLSPFLEAIWLNMRGAREAHCICNYEGARELWHETLRKIEALPPNQEGFVGPMRNAVVFAAGTAESQLGLVSAVALAERLDSDAFQHISGLTLRKLVRLEQGDATEAERLRRQAEVLSLQQRMPQMFHSGLAFAVFAYGRCNDLTGLTQTIEEIKVLAARYPSWVPVLLHGEGTFQLVRGDYEAARAKFETALALESQGGARMYTWTRMTLRAGLAECLFGLGRIEQARSVASEALGECEARGASVSAFEIIQVLALSEAKLGDPRGAARLDALIARQNALGTTGLRVGLSYEARARVAILSGDAATFERFSELTAREYRHGARTPLAARYERLMNEAARAGMQAKLTLKEFQALADVTTISRRSGGLRPLVMRSMAGHHGVDERALVALQMTCIAHTARSGLMYMLTPAGVTLLASHGDFPPVADLAERVARYAAEQEQPAEDLDEMATEVLADVTANARVPEVDEHGVQLLPLRLAVNDTRRLVAVAVIERPGGSRAAEHTELLGMLAASLLESDAPDKQ